MKVFMFRHQHAGIVTSHVFSKSPTVEQIAPLKAEVERQHGREGWGMIHEAELLSDEVPVFAAPAGPSLAGEVAAPTVTAVVEVSTQGEK